jgi:multimeric flavodoxin WrbA
MQNYFYGGLLFKTIASNGSHRKAKTTAAMLNLVLDEARALGAEGELLEITDFNIKPCKSCNKCLRQTKCSITDDDMAYLGQKMMDADGIVIGSPVYFCNVTGLLKIFMDRTRWLHVSKNLLEGKIGAAITHAGLRNGGQELTLLILERFLISHGLHIVESRKHGGGVSNLGGLGTMFSGFQEGNIIWYKSVLDDELTVRSCRQLGENIVETIRRYRGK